MHFAHVMHDAHAAIVGHRLARGPQRRRLPNGAEHNYLELGCGKRIGDRERGQAQYIQAQYIQAQCLEQAEGVRGPNRHRERRHSHHR